MDAGSAHDFAQLRLDDHSWYRLAPVAACSVWHERLLAPLRDAGLPRSTA